MKQQNFDLVYNTGIFRIQKKKKNKNKNKKQKQKQKQKQKNKTGWQKFKKRNAPNLTQNKHTGCHFASRLPFWTSDRHIGIQKACYWDDKSNNS